MIHQKRSKFGTVFQALCRCVAVVPSEGTKIFPNKEQRRFFKQIFYKLVATKGNEVLSAHPSCKFVVGCMCAITEISQVHS